MEVVRLRWPVEEERRSELRAAGVPRLLLVEPGAGPPSVTDLYEDWVRVPADEVDVRARIAVLVARVGAEVPADPVLDDDGVLRVGRAWVPLPPVEARLTAALIERFGAVVSRDALARAGWPEGLHGRNALDVHVLRLRRRVATVGLAIRTVRSRGYVLDSAA